MQLTIERLLLLPAVFGLACMTFCVGVAAQETVEEQIVQSGTEVSATEVPEASVASGDNAAEIDALEPGVISAVLAQDIRRVEVANGVMDEIDLSRTEITGNQELPKVLYIVPWKKSDPGDLMGMPANSLLDEVLAPLDRSEFIRHVDYYNDLYGQQDK